METFLNKSLSAIVADDYRTAAVFQRYGIAFCCKGTSTIQEACETRKLDFAEVKKEVLAIYANKETTGADYTSWPLPLLADYIEKKHHRYVIGKIPVLNAYLGFITTVHKAQHPELQEIYTFFTESAAALQRHTKEQEATLFPSIRKLFHAGADMQTMAASASGTLQNLIEAMMSEQEQEGERFMKIAELSNQYRPPAGACPTYKAAFATLQEFEKDLHTHIHLENNILFPGAMEQEKQLFPH
ncbi:DUF542 domain-containing protein [Pontibacter sp. 172403-2]|uniref:DUF542 domain-containing protein n=1 Tax=Pontibacter rufus TaxID=2791028 RepID=UPI0018AF961D|nr:DUF542 domain-containing protein [Pontibacter sp. 172403-2]MBF9254140.1 DUF542 domain-containing protein [Pontibacter sp. 172403-2]